MPARHLISQAVQELEAASRLRDPRAAREREAAVAQAHTMGRPLLDCSSNDYLGLAALGVSRETLAGMVGLDTGAGASRLVHGTRQHHEDLEGVIAHWVGHESALLFTSGFAANLGTIAALADSGLIVSDALNHASIIDGCRLSRAEVVVVPHLDLEAVETQLRGSRHECRWVITESYFSMDGDGPDLGELKAVCERYEAGLIVDEAHAMGIFGLGGSGRCQEAGVRPDVLVGTFGKAVGTQGAFVASADSIRTWLWNRARSFVFSTAPSPLLAQLTLLHVKHVQQLAAERAYLLEAAARLRCAFNDRAIPTIPQSFGPIVPLLVGDEDRALRMARRLRVRGILAQAIRPPTVPPGTSRLRLTVRATWSEAEVTRLVDEVVWAWQAV